MKALTILEPWASLIACDAKRIETRSWYTNYRGEIAIHAGKNEKHLSIAFQEPFLSALKPIRNKIHISSHSTGEEEEFLDFKFGHVIATTMLINCVGTGVEKYGGSCILENGVIVHGDEFIFGDYTTGRYAWILNNIKRIEPVPAVGRQGIWNWEEMK